jgi:UDP-glucose 4-epimerase
MKKIADDPKEKVLVTGGAGFIGSHVARELLLLGYDVLVLDDLSGGFKENVPLKAEFVQGSVYDVELLSKLFKRHQFDYVFHLAAYAAEGLSHFIKRFNYMNNVVGSVNMINESVKHNIKCFVFTSSIGVYGENQTPLNEELTPMPEDSYSIAKLAVEMELKISQKMFGLNYVIFRPHNVYGENQNISDKFRNVVGIFMNNIMQNKPLLIFGDGKQTRAFSYIADVAPVIAQSIEYPKCYGQTFNIGADQAFTINELAEAVMKAMGTKVEIIHVEARNEVKHAYADHGKVRKFFGNQKYVGLQEGLAQMAQWAKRAGIRQSKDFDSIEIYKSLPSVWLK